LHGAITMGKLVSAQKQAIEAQAGVKLELLANGAGRGLTDLCAGQAEIALMGGSLKGVSEAMNKEKPGSVDISGLKEIPLTKVKVAFITHPGVGVKSLTDAQARDILTGKVTNWKEVGGADLPVKVVLAFAGDGARVTMQEALLKDATYLKTAIQRNSAKDISLVVSQLPGACGTLSVKNIDATVASVALEKDVEMPMSFVVKGELAGDVKKVVDAATALIH